MATPLKESSSNGFNRRVLAKTCVLNDVLAKIALRWKMQVLFAIHSGHGTFAALKRELPTVSDHVLAHRLRELVLEGLVVRGPSPHACYMSTERGASLLRICQDLCRWGSSGARSGNS